MVAYWLHTIGYCGWYCGNWRASPGIYSERPGDSDATVVGLLKLNFHPKQRKTLNFVYLLDATDAKEEKCATSAADASDENAKTQGQKRYSDLGLPFR